MIHFAVFAKYWEAGKVKTRLASKLGEDLACEVYFRFVKHLLKRFVNCANARTVVYSPPDKAAQFRDEVPSEWGIAPQSQGDLGDRMFQFFDANAEDGKKNILIGSDTPNIPVEFIDLTSEWLNRCDVVLGPSADGGYYLIAMQTPFKSLFENVPWSTNRVLDRTVEILKANSVRYQLLPEMKDVDEASDLKLLVDALKTSVNPIDVELLDELLRLELELD